MDALVLILVLGMPAAIFLLALRALLVRLRLESCGAMIGARIVNGRAASGDLGEAEELLTYRFRAAGEEFTGTVQLSTGRRPRSKSSR